MIILPVKNMTLSNAPGTPYAMPYRPASAYWPVGYIAGVPTKFISDYGRSRMGFFQCNRFFPSFAETTIPLLNNPKIFRNEYIISIKSGQRYFNKVNYSVSPYDGRIDGVKLSDNVSMQYCGTGGVNTVTGFITLYMDSLTRVVVRNTYSGGVTGGADTTSINMLNNETIGFNAKFNGYGWGPYETFVGPLNTSGNNAVVQISENIMVAADSKFIYIYGFDNGISGRGSCLYNEIKPKVSLLDKIAINDIIGIPVYDFDPPQLTSRMDSSFMGVAYAPGNQSFVFIVKYPGPVVQTVRFPYFGSAKAFAAFLDNDGYILIMNNSFNLLNNIQNVYVSSDKVDMNITFTAPAQTPPPRPVNIINTSQRKNINRGF